jgi:hypothetical protein
MEIDYSFIPFILAILLFNNLVIHGFSYQFTHDSFITHWYGWRKKIYPKETLEFRYNPKWLIFNIFPVLYQVSGKKKKHIKVPYYYRCDPEFLAHLTLLTGEPGTPQWEKYLKKVTGSFTIIEKIFLSIHFLIPLALYLWLLLAFYPAIPDTFMVFLLLIILSILYLSFFITLNNISPRFYKQHLATHSQKCLFNIAFVLLWVSFPLMIVKEVINNPYIYYSGLALCFISNILFLILINYPKLQMWIITALSLVIFTGVLALVPKNNMIQLTSFTTKDLSWGYSIKSISKDEILVYTIQPHQWIYYKEGNKLPQAWNTIPIDTTCYDYATKLIFDPEGNKLVTVLNREDSPGISELYGMSEGKFQLLNTLKRVSTGDVFPVSYSYWSPDGNYLLYWVNNQKSLSDKPLNSLTLQEYGKDPKTIYQTRRNVNGIDWVKDGFAYTLEWTADTVGKDIRSIYYMEKFDMASALNHPGSMVQPVPIKNIELPRAHKHLPRFYIKPSPDGKYYFSHKDLEYGVDYRSLGNTSTGDETYPISSTANISNLIYQGNYPDSSHFVMAKQIDKKHSALVKVDLSTGKETLIKEIKGNVLVNSVSPDGKHIIYFAEGAHRLSGDYYQINMDGTDQKYLFINSYLFDLYPSCVWTADSRHLYVLQERYRKSRIVAVLNRIDFQ